MENKPVSMLQLAADAATQVRPAIGPAGRVRIQLGDGRPVAITRRALEAIQSKRQAVVPPVCPEPDGDD
ncbi:MAG: hypothetical protein NTY19_24075 [Planctomycetota bacterium]|nr:hypothetical protein [Planctomycetota bacterium]